MDRRPTALIGSGPNRGIMRVPGRQPLLPLLILLAGALARPCPARAAVPITVDTTVDEDVDNARCSLREAIIAANTNTNYHGCAGSGGGARRVRCPC